MNMEYQKLNIMLTNPRFGLVIFNEDGDDEDNEATGQRTLSTNAFGR